MAASGSKAEQSHQEVAAEEWYSRWRAKKSDSFFHGVVYSALGS